MRIVSLSEAQPPAVRELPARVTDRPLEVEVRAVAAGHERDDVLRRADAHVAAGDTDPALALLDAEDKARPNRAEVMARRILALEARGDHERGKTLFHRHERRPLHATFLLDARGRIRWRDIGNIPFVDSSWLLEESQRLLEWKGPSPNPAHRGRDGWRSSGHFDPPAIRRDVRYLV